MDQTCTTYSVGIYCRLSKDDDHPGESMSIGNQRAMLMEYCEENNYHVFGVYVDDGFSGLTFDRADFQRLITDIENGSVNMVITKDLSRLGRDYIQMGYYTEIYFPSRNVRYVALSDGFDSNKASNDIAPFMNVLNDMYARDISRKVKAAKLQRAKKGICSASEAPYGYCKKEGRLVVDPVAAETVKLVFHLAAEGNGAIRIASNLYERRIPKPAVYKYRIGRNAFALYGDITGSEVFEWSASTINAMLSNRVYIGEMISHKSEVVNYKTKERRPVPMDQRIVFPHAHEAIIDEELFEQVQAINANIKVSHLAWKR